MRRATTIIPWVTALFLLAGAASAGTLTETFEESYRVTPGQKLELSNENGGITIESWDRPQVQIEAEKVVKGSGQAAREALAELAIEVRETREGIEVVTRSPRKRGEGLLHWLAGNHVETHVSYRIRVPRKFDVRLETINGTIRASDLDGALFFETINGSIRLARAAGSLEASTVNGSIEAELNRVNRGSSMKLATTNGRISLALPSDFQAEIDAATTNGSVESDFPISATSFRKTRVKGSINGGGAMLRLRTTNGSIRLARL